MKRFRRALATLASPLIGPLVRVATATLRVRLAGNERGIEVLTEGPKAIFVFWHADILGCGLALHRNVLRRRRGVAALISRSNDGEILARAASFFGFETVRGSSSRGGLRALRGLLNACRRDGSSLAITPDGPRGPAERASPGVAQLAILSGGLVVPMAARSPGELRARSWDRTRLPRPFSRIVVTVGKPIQTAQFEDVEVLVARIEQRLRAVGSAQ